MGDGTGSRDVVLVDWLGRGGIAQTSEAWRRTLCDLGCEVGVVTRAGRELRSDVSTTVTTRFGYAGRIINHRAVVRAATSMIREARPRVVIVQNYVVPSLEWPVYRAAIDVGAQLVFVVHDFVPNSRVGGVQFGLGRLLRGADSVVVHTDFVGGQIVRSSSTELPVERIEHPLPVGLLDEPASTGLVGPDRRPTAIQFGILGRRYKNASMVQELEHVHHEHWRFVASGVGARARHGVAIDRFLAPDELVSVVSAADVALLPYRWASQSGAVVLAQALGTVPIASAVGGIPEQITDGVDGVLLPADASRELWSAALERLAEPEVRAQLAAAGRARVAEAHLAFQDAVARLVGPVR